MINLIPPEGLQAVKREYIFRVGSTLALLFSAVFILLSVSLIPTYVLLESETNILANETGRTSDVDTKLNHVETEILMINNILTQVKSVGNETLPSSVIEAIQASAPAGVLLKNFSMNMSNGSIDSVQIQGVASTRESLVQFRTAVEALPLFGKAEIPLSDLAKDTNLPFGMVITLTQEKK